MKLRVATGRVRNTYLYIGLMLCLLPAVSAAQNTCPAANPDDYTSDSQALQNCLNQGGTIVLRPGAYYYVIDAPLTLTVDGTVLTSSGGQAMLLAVDPLYGAMLTATANNYEIANVWFHGGKWIRTLGCYGYRGYASNLLLRGSGFRVHDSKSEQALCGSAMEIDGSYFEVYGNWVAYNGKTSGSGEPWSDGITLLRCMNGYVHHNELANNTDIDIVIGGGGGCRVQNNTIRHTPGPGSAIYGFAGIHIQNFPDNGGGDHSSSNYSGNTITADADKLAFGIIVGPHPWNSDLWVSGASVTDNSAFGSVVNLAVDGSLDGQVSGNTASGARGTQGFNCNIAADYTAGHFGSTSLQGGYTCRIYHQSGCLNTCY